MRGWLDSSDWVERYVEHIFFRFSLLRSHNKASLAGVKKRERGSDNAISAPLSYPSTSTPYVPLHTYFAK